MAEFAEYLQKLQPYTLIIPNKLENSNASDYFFDSFQNQNHSFPPPISDSTNHQILNCQNGFTDSKNKPKVELQSQASDAGRGKKGKKVKKLAHKVIHVRAKRGQATDSHSVAERVRREKINNKFRCLQDIVPGCHKSMGMAVMLGEIINYVHSLQNQVEFLSMEIAAAAASSCNDFNLLKEYSENLKAQATTTAGTMETQKLSWNQSTCSI